MDIFVVGIGPGKHTMLTYEADKVLSEVDIIVGYSVYVDLVREYYPDKEYMTTGMTKEVDRCRMALEAAGSGKRVAMICSGDSGVYGMAGIMLELAEEYKAIEVIVVPGITAALSGGAVLGAPLGHDFAVISLSDLLTPWELIEKRLACMASADMAMAIYNPSSKKRSDYLKKACDIIISHGGSELVCGYVKNIGRDREEARVLTIEELRECELDMFTTVFIGNSQTKNIGGHMVTPRGYRK